MNSNSTKVPGAGADYNDFYSRGNAGNPSTQGTVIPGMDKYAPNVAASGNVAAPSKPVVGFLYSISRQGFGEYWPLYIGSNSVGRSADCDICLPEKTVSANHALINVKQMKTTKKVIASIRDDRSSTPIFVNDEELEYEAHEIKDKDILTIGENYQLLVVLIDAEKYGLKVSENFQPTETLPDPLDIHDDFYGDATDTSGLYNGANRVENGTVALDGSVTPPPTKRTKFL